MNKKNGLLFISIILMLASIISVTNAAMEVNFTSNVTTGITPLAVGFTGMSSGSSLTNWSWYFGDENYQVPWTLVNASAPWTGRSTMGIATLPNGHIVLTGGGSDANPSLATNETWLSSDNGKTWIEMNASSGWFSRYSHSMVVLSDGSLVLMGGRNRISSDLDIFFNDTWRSEDEGATWTLVNASSGWGTRNAFQAVTMPDDTIILMGGVSPNGARNDTWKSTDQGRTWMPVNASSGWSARLRFASVVLPDSSIVLTGGTPGSSLLTVLNDTWKSTDQGQTWMLVNASSGWSARGRHNSVALPDGNIMLMGGEVTKDTELISFFNDTWLSRDKGATWKLLNASSEWMPRYASRSTLTSDGRVLMMGGIAASDYKYHDVWSFNPVGSSMQSPSHLYSSAGTYSVALLVHNATETNSTLKVGYINVNAPVAPTTNFTAMPTSGTAPLTVQFNDTSTGSPNGWKWNWSFGDGNTTNSTVQNPVHTYFTRGNFTVSLNATNFVGSNITTKIQYINVTNVPDKIGVYNNGVWYLDYNGNGTWDGAAIDKNYNFGGPGNVSVAGDWNGDGITEIGVTNGVDWYLDGNGNGTWDGPTIDKYGNFGITGYTPVVGDWNGDNKTEIGVTNGINWYLDDNGNGIWDGTPSDKYGYFGITGYTPVVGDWNGDGKTEIGVTNSVNWYLDSNGNGIWDGQTVDIHGYFGITGWTPVVGRW